MQDFAHFAVFFLLNFEKTSPSLNIVILIQFFALNSNMKSEFQSEIRNFCNSHFNFLVQDKSLIMIFLLIFQSFSVQKLVLNKKVFL